MKQKTFILLTGILILIILSGCPVIPEKADTGLFTLTMNLGFSGRTILPDVSSSISSYLIEFSGPSTVSPVSTASSSVTINLPVGTWDITVSGMDSSLNVVAAGTVTGVVITNGCHVDESVSLSPLSAGTGSVDVTISWPESQDITDTSAIKFDGITYNTSASEISFNGIERTLVFQVSGIASGNHVFIAYLREADGLKAAVSESVQVYDNLSSSESIALTEDDFTQPPEASVLNTPVEGNGQITLSWENSSMVITGYSVERSLEETTGYSEVGTTSGITLSYTDTTVVRGTLYYYRIIASSAGGESTSNTVSLASASPIPGNSGMIEFSAITDSSVTLSWTKAEDNTSPQSALEYRVVQSESDNIDITINAENNGVQVQDWTTDIDTCEADELTSGTIYYFNVMMRDEAGNTGIYTMNSVTPEEGELNLTITVTEPDDETITFSENDDVSVSQSGILTIEVSESFDSYSWYLDGVEVTGQTTGTFTHDCSGTSLGVHHLAVFVTMNGMLYSNTVRFIVTN